MEHLQVLLQFKTFATAAFFLKHFADLFCFSLYSSPAEALLMDYAVPPKRVESNGFIHPVTEPLQKTFSFFGIEPRFSKAVSTNKGVDPLHNEGLYVSLFISFWTA